jgi:4-amino-4-deoxy-L-arabinose transferase-like glycosyltransferase
VSLLFLMGILWIPLAGNYGMWDPWETHYGEVARQMLERNDFVSQWWPGSPQDRAEFWSKPVLTFWLMAIGMKLFGLEWGASPPPSEIADSWRVEWACRLPFILLSIAAVWFVWQLVRRLAGARAAIFAGVALATSSQWVLITRQAMTDMAFVSPMTIALALAGLGLLLPEEERELELPRRRRRLGRFTLSWPHTTSFYAFVALFALTVVPQLVMISIQVRLVLRLSSMNVRISGVVAMLPYIAAFLLALWWCARARNRRQLYLFSGYVLCGLASLAKGPAGIALPAIVLVVYLVVAGRWRDILVKLEIPRGVLIVVATAFPWYHAMLIRHGMGFWNEFIGDNYVHRAGGRHGDRGTFEYYLQWVGYGMFPWSGLATLGGLLSFKWLERGDKRRGLIGFALVWFVAEWAVMALVQTKFHHYILPALPALAILVGVLVDELLAAPSRLHVAGLFLVAVPVTFFCGRDLAAFPPRIGWLFNYDYVNMPGTGRPWPLVSLYGDRYEYGQQIFIFAVAATLAVLALAVWAAVARRAEASSDPDRATAAPSSDEVEGAAPAPLGRGTALAIVALFVAALVAGILSGPSSPGGAAPTIARTAWMVPTALMLPVLALVVVAARRVGRGNGLGRIAPWALGAVAVVWTGFIADKWLVELSPHWSQKHVIASYFKHRASEREPLIAWMLYWRGENFYTKNSIYSSSDPAERTVFLGDRNVEKLQAYLNSHPGRRVFFVVERARYEGLRGVLPEKVRPTLTIVDDTNNKLYLASAQL